jgi:hypothetical protein
MNERRFCVLDVDPRCEQNHEYFREIDEELEHGGLEYLLADLLAFNLDAVNLRQIPRTEALLEQKIRSLESVESWWFERLMSSSTTRHETRWLQEVPTAVRRLHRNCRQDRRPTQAGRDGLRNEAQPPRAEPWAHPSVDRSSG